MIRLESLRNHPVSKVLLALARKKRLYTKELSKEAEISVRHLDRAVLPFMIRDGLITPPQYVANKVYYDLTDLGIGYALALKDPQRFSRYASDFVRWLSTRGGTPISTETQETNLQEITFPIGSKPRPVSAFHFFSHSPSSRSFVKIPEKGVEVEWLKVVIQVLNALALRYSSSYYLIEARKKLEKALEQIITEKLSRTEIVDQGALKEDEKSY